MRAQARAVPGAVWLLVALHLGLLTGYAVLVPTWRAPDEPQHADMVFAVRDGGGWPDRGERRLTARIVRSYDHASFDFVGRETEPRLEAPAAVPREARPTFAEIAPDDNIGSRNGQFQHPPLYYLTVATALTFVTSLVPGAEGWSYDVVVVAMRLVSALLVAPLPLLAYLSARRLRVAEAVALAAAAFPLAIPGLTHIGAAVNPDALLIGAVGVLTLAVTRVLTGDLSRRTAVWVGLAAGVALLAKGLALFTPALVLAAYWVAAGGRRGGHLRQAAARLLLAGMVALAAGGWWWFRNLAVYGSIQPTGATIPPAPEGFTPHFVEWLRAAVTLLPPRWWGSFGWYQAELPGPVAWSATAVVGLAVVAALLVGGQRAGRHGVEAPFRARLLVLLAPLVGIGGIVAVGAWGYYAESSLTPGLQGRYLYPAVTGLSVVAAVGLSAVLGGRDRFLPTGVLVTAGLLQAIAVVTIALRWYGIPGVRSPAATVAALLAWSPWGRVGILLIGATVVGAGLGAAALLTGRALRRGADPGCASSTSPVVRS